MISSLGNGEPMDHRPTNASPHDPPPLGFEKLASALSRLGDTPPPLSEAQRNRIQSRIFAAASDATIALIDWPVPTRGERIKVPDDRTLERIVGRIDDLDEIEREREGKAKRRPLAIKMAAGFLAIALIMPAIIAGSGQATPGSLMYPIKLQVEKIMLARAGSGLPLARAHIDIATARFEELRQLRRGSPQTLANVTGSMDSSGLEALSIARFEPESPERIAILSDLLALALSQRMHLEHKIPRTHVSVLPPIVRSYRTADRIVAETSELLSIYGTLPRFAVVNASIDRHALTPPTTASQTATQVHHPDNSGQQAQPPGSPGSPDDQHDPDDPPEQPCDFQGGEICIHIPRLPLTPPPL